MMSFLFKKKRKTVISRCISFSHLLAGVRKWGEGSEQQEPCARGLGQGVQTGKGTKMAASILDSSWPSHKKIPCQLEELQGDGQAYLLQPLDQRWPHTREETVWVQRKNHQKNVSQTIPRAQGWEWFRNQCGKISRFSCGNEWVLG